MPCEIGGCREAAPDRRAPGGERFTLDLTTNVYLAYYILQAGDPIPEGCGVGDWILCTVHPCRARGDIIEHPIRDEFGNLLVGSGTDNAQAMGHHMTGRLCIDGRGDWVPVIEHHPQQDSITGWFAYATGQGAIMQQGDARLGLARGDMCFCVPIQLPFWTDANLNSAVGRCGGPES